jgi:hypothetical protein
MDVGGIWTLLRINFKTKTKPQFLAAQAANLLILEIRVAKGHRNMAVWLLRLSIGSK